MTIDEFRIIEDRYASHDCHLSPDDSCQTCVDYFISLKDIHDTHTEMEIEQELLAKHEKDGI